MKKLLIGCGVLVLVLAIVAGWAFWQFVWKPGSQFMGEGLKTVTETVQRAKGLGETTARLRELEKGIHNQGEYAPPADGLIQPDQLARWLTVELTAREAIAADFKRLEDEISQSVTAPEATAAGKAQRMRAGLAALNQLGEIAIRAKEAQVRALNAAGMSLAEYQWVRDTGLAALVAGGMSVGLDALGQTAQQAEQARRALADAGQAMEGLAPEVRGILEQLPGLLSGGSDSRSKEPDGAGEGESAPAAPQTGEAQAPSVTSDPARDAAARANFELVKDHAEAFAGARVLSMLGI
jgi:hypothetical protein